MPTSPVSIRQIERPKVRLRATIVTLLFASLALSACRDKKKAEVEETRTEPWRKEEAQNEKEARKLAVYRIEPGQSLEFDLRTRRSKPGGSLREPRGALRLDLEAVESSAGEIALDLNQIEFSLPPIESTTKSSKGKTGASADAASFEGMNWTEEAKRWLGLGEKVSPTVRQRAAQARFAFDSCREVSHHSARSGIKKRSPQGFSGDVREVRAICAGELSLGDLVVQREVRLLLRFLFSNSDPAGSPPQAMEVHLRDPLGIPLDEYNIAPKNDEGHLDSEKQRYIGKVVGSTVRVTGDLRLSRDPESR